MTKGWQRVLLLIIPYILTVSFFQNIGFLFAGINYLKNKYPTTLNQHLILSFCTSLGTFIIVGVFAKHLDKINWIDLGFRLKNRFYDIVLGIFLGALMILSGFCILLYLGEIEVVNVFFDIKSIIAITVLCILVSVTEEFLLRGYVLRNLMQSFNKYKALVLSSVIFSLMHGVNPNVNYLGLLNIFLAGILLGLPYLYTKNLWFSISIHFSWNFFQTLLGFNVSGINIYSLVELNIPKYNLWNGGNFGFEGSILSVLNQTMLIIFIIIFFNTKLRVDV